MIEMSIRPNEIRTLRELKKGNPTLNEGVA